MTELFNGLVTQMQQFFKTLVKENPKHEKELEELCKDAVAIVKGIAHLVTFLENLLVDDAGKQLIEAKSLKKELDMIIEKEIFPKLKILETKIKRGFNDDEKKKVLRSSRDEIVKEIGKAIDYLQTECKSVEKRMIHSKNGETRNRNFKYLSGGVVAVSAWGVKIAADSGDAFPLLVGLGIVIFSGIGFYLFGEQQSTYRQAIEVLDLAMEKALKTKERLRKAKIDLGEVCGVDDVKFEVPA